MKNYIFFVVVVTVIAMSSCGGEAESKPATENLIEPSTEKISNDNELIEGSEQEEFSEDSETKIGKEEKEAVEEAAMEEEEMMVEDEEIIDYSGHWVWKGSGDSFYSIKYPEGDLNLNSNPMGLILGMGSGEIQIPTIGRGYGDGLDIEEVEVKIGKGEEIVAVRKSYINGSSTILVQYIANNWALNFCVSGKNLSKKDIKTFDRMAKTLELVTEKELEEFEKNKPVLSEKDIK